MDQLERTRQAFEDPEWYLGSRDYNIRLRAEVVRAFSATSKNERMLDIGCGDGSISLPLLAPNNRLTLLDLSTSMLKIAESRIAKKFLGQVETINSGFMEAQLEPKSYDLILCIGVLAYVDDLPSFCLKLASLIKPGGTAVVECTDSNHFVSHLISGYGKLRGLFGPAKVPLCLRPSADVQKALFQVGFRLQQSFRHSLPLPIVAKLFSQSFHYKIGRLVFGRPPFNRNSWLGNECISSFIAGVDEGKAHFLEDKTSVA
jgi:ubiquinone/menaquinone biosynthesis C-methylase UbiE